jgi:hypothetical protein
MGKNEVLPSLLITNLINIMLIKYKYFDITI